jgi:outer membrane immunogenic protein
MKIDTWILASVAVMSLTTAAFASDLPSKKSPAVAPVVVANVNDWSGFYVGGAIGFVNSSISFDDVNGRYNPAGTKYSSFSNAATASARGGFNYKIADRYVLGLETDVRFSNASSSNGYDGGSDLITTKANYMGSTRVRLGMTAGDALLFVTGGVAYGNPASKVNNSSDADLFDNSTTHFGYAVGGGIEYRMAKEWSVSVEGLYYKLNTFSNNGVCAGENCGNRIDVNYDQLVTQVGINYHF